MSNPYGGPDPEPPYVPYGSSPYGGAPSPYGAPAGGPGLDPVSITGFVLSLLCCTGLVGMILGIVGISRTRAGVRKGRWAAVAAIVIGAVGTLASAGAVVFFVWFGTSTTSVGSADVGQCLDIDEFSSGHDATLFKKDCEEEHEAEVAATGDFDASQVDAYDDTVPAAMCEALLADEYDTAYSAGGFRIGIVFEDDDPQPGDAFLCYLERSDGRDLDAPIRTDL